MIGIVAVDNNNAIGLNGNMPWYYPEDLKWFKTLTHSNIVVMGRITYQAIGEKELEDRLNIVITSQLRNSQNIIFLQNPANLIKLKDYLNKPIFIIGGSEIFSLYQNHINYWFVTRIPLEISDADTFMHKSFLDKFYRYSEFNLSDELISEFYVRKGKKPDNNVMALIYNAVAGL
jgi:dihydrofolate reductase